MAEGGTNAPCICGYIPTYDMTKPVEEGGNGWHLAPANPQSMFGHQKDCPAWRALMRINQKTTDAPEKGQS